MTTYVARQIDDFVTASICKLGFVPRNSMMAIISPEGTGRYSCAYRLDLDELEVLGETMLRFVAPMPNPTAAVIVFDGDAEMTQKVEALVSEILPVTLVAHTDLETVWELGTSTQGVPLNLHDHPLIAEMIGEGRPVLRSREEMANVYRAGIAPNLVTLEDIEAARKDAADDPAEWLTRAATLTTRGTAGENLTDQELAHVVAATLIARARDLLWTQITSQNSAGALQFWTSIAQRTPEASAAPALTLAGFAAWQSGDGSATTEAVGAALKIDPTYSMATLMEEILAVAVPPGAWSGFNCLADDLLEDAVTDLQASTS